MRVTPFSIDVPDAILADLAARLDRTRLAAEVDAGDWARGTHRSYLASLVHYWRHGGDATDAFDVVPSLPEYGFTDRPTTTGTTFRIGELWRTPMTKALGYERTGRAAATSRHSGSRICSPPICASSSGRCGPPRRTHHERNVTTWHPSARKS